MKNVLVLGSRGFIGSHMVEQLRDYRLYCPSSSELNLLNREQLVGYVVLNKIDVIVDATCWSCYYSDKDQSKVLQYNIRMFSNVCACSKYVDRIIYYGSGAEYDKRFWKANMSEQYFGLHIPEDDNGFSKYMNTIMAMNYDNIYCLRVLGVYGPRENEHRFISYCLHSIINRTEININQDRCFDYIHILDLCYITKIFIESDPKERVYNICSGVHDLTLSAIATIATNVAGYSRINILNKEMGLSYTGDNTLFVKEFGYNADFIPLSDGIRGLSNYIRDHK